MLSGSKRKRNQYDSDDEEPALGRQILPVANLPEDFNDEPMDGLQYLFTVRRDARYLPHTTRVINPYEVPEQPPLSSLDKPPDAVHPPLPTDEWRESFKNHFSYFRMNIVQPTIHIHIPQTPQHKVIPDIKQRSYWWAFIAGQPESDWNVPRKPISERNMRRRRQYSRAMSTDSYSAEEEIEIEAPQETWHINNEGEVELAPKDNPTESLPTPSGTPGPPEQKSRESDLHPASEDKFHDLKEREPTPSLIAHLNHRTSLHLLMYFAHWINSHLENVELATSRITEVHARWIFALLSRVEEHISADDMSLLRNLARAVLALLKGLMQKGRSSNDADDHLPQVNDLGAKIYISERSCWMIIALMVDFWGQKDLWVDADAMLATL